MGGSKKKYKLFSSADGGAGKQPCAFFASPDGCRNGNNCKFAHVLGGQEDGDAPPSGEVKSPGSVVSSESSEGGEVVAAAEKTKSPTKINANTNTKIEEQQANDTKQKNKSATRRGKRKTDDFPFANPKKVKVNSNSEQRPPQEQRETAEPTTSTTSASSNPPSTTKKQKAKKQKASAESATPKPSADGKPSSSSVDFRSLNLPVASFTIPEANNAATKSLENPKAAAESTPSNKNTATGSPLPLPKSSAAGRKWLLAVENTYKHRRYNDRYDFEKFKDLDAKSGHTSNSWIKSKPYGSWCEKLPQVIAIDCEMCETQDPVTGERDPRALCRVSIIDAVTDEVLIDTLVKPAWPVIDHRTWINGISAEHLENVQFTVRHAQAFMMALCSEETVIVGHAVNNDLAAMRMEHYCVADSAALYSALDSETATVGLKDLAASILKKKMPDKHDSVNDARTALACVQHYIDKAGKVDGVERVASKKANHASQLFVHRIPSKCNEEHLSKMFLLHTSVEPTEVNSIELLNGVGKTIVHFRTPKHANLAFDTLESKAEAESSGRLQKKVFLRDGGYIRVRKMAYDKKKSRPWEGGGSGQEVSSTNKRQETP